jgi:hypothetical protein
MGAIFKAHENEPSRERDLIICSKLLHLKCISNTDPGSPHSVCLSSSLSMDSSVEP